MPQHQCVAKERWYFLRVLIPDSLLQSVKIFWKKVAMYRSHPELWCSKCGVKSATYIRKLTVEIFTTKAVLVLFYRLRSRTKIVWIRRTTKKEAPSKTAFSFTSRSGGTKIRICTCRAISIDEIKKNGNCFRCCSRQRERYNGNGKNFSHWLSMQYELTHYTAHKCEVCSLCWNTDHYRVKTLLEIRSVTMWIY